MFAEANRIKERLSACTTVEEVERVAEEERAAVMAMQGKGGNQGAMFYHIINLKKYMINEIKRAGQDGH
ncbi:hypothetical protein VWZ88_12615 [Phaeobacter sp. JH20_36]|uniref:hypothetical protein n=1 Tax=Phaeobacter TaxID=302485 RepID=UPI0027497EA6|nr:hypothetical protein [Phaeobacter inhibens]GLO70322.1 hypothetical protein MACH17_18390 [Phaeobacter inhibens]